MMARRRALHVISRTSDHRKRIAEELDPVAKLIPPGRFTVGIIDDRGTWGGIYKLPGELGPRSFICSGPLARELCWYALTEVLFGEDYDSIREQLARVGFFTHS